MSDLYERDFVAWTRLQARHLRGLKAMRSNLPLDYERLAEEIEDLGKEQRNAARSWTIRIIEHLLLLEHSPADAPRRHWTHEVLTFRREVETRLTRTLRRDLRQRLPKLYARARADLARELELFGEQETAASLPESCPYTLEQVLGHWLPHDPR